MRQLKFQCLFGGITLAGMTVLLLWISRIPSPVSAQLAASPTATSSPTPTTTPTTTATATRQPGTTLNDDSYKTLITHFEKISSSILEIAKWVVIIVGTLGGLSGAYSILETRKIQVLRNETVELEAKIGRLKSELEESRQLSMHAANRLSYILEIRDRNYEVRVRAAQQLGASNDIAAVSILAGLLETDLSMDVKLEAAYGLGRLLSEGDEPGALDEGIQALLKGTRDNSEKVRVEAIEALDTLVCNSIELPRTAHRRLQELVEHDTIEDVVKTAKETLKHLKQQRERKLNSPGPEEN